ncbi:choice-of-anchor B family protein [bacterium]|nr:choice-of-anchor B family protein [bacterium]
MKRLILFVLLYVWLGIFAFSQELLNEGAYFFQGVYHSSGDTTGASDVWGWTAPDGTDYAIMGTSTGTAFIRTSDMAVTGFVPGPEDNDYYYHRDIKTYKHYAYVVSEMTGLNQGLQIIDMSTMPAGANLVTAKTDFNIRSHNMSIDTLQGFAYVISQDYEDLYMLDLSDPEVPVVVGILTEPGMHDVFARNDTIWLASGTSFSVWDLRDKSNPQLITRITDANFGYCHNIWPTDDSQYFITTEETPNKTVKVWDMKDPLNTTMIGEYLGECDIAHNVHVMGDSVYISHYASGVKVIDISDKTNPIEVGYFDTYNKDDEPGFYGCWGVYPFTASGQIYASSFEGWLHVVDFDRPGVSIDPTGSNLSGVKVSPNPFSSETHISFDLKKSGQVSVKIVDLMGKVVADLGTEEKQTGPKTFSWSPKESLTSGIYLYKITSETGQTSGKIWLKK